MDISENRVVSSHKTGAENIIMMRLPTDRFQTITSFYDPPTDKKSRFTVALLAQSCNRVIFDNDNTGPGYEVHLWLQLASIDEKNPIQDADLKLPTTQWLSLACAAENPSVQHYMQSFGIQTQNLKKIILQEQGGSILFPDNGSIDWKISGSGKKLHKVDVKHVLFNTDAKPGSTGHHIKAILTDAVMEQYGKVHIQTAAFEPFLIKGEKITAFIHRTGKLEADILWQLL